MLNNEIWKPVVGYQGIYEVSDHGRVRSLDRIDTISRKRKGKILSACPAGVGHLEVRLCNGERTKRYVHRLVMEAFVGPCPDGMEVCHKDHNKSNNKLDNLMYGTRSENNRQSAEAGIGCKPIRRSDGREFISAAEAERDTGVHHGHVSKVCRNERKTAGGFGVGIHLTYDASRLDTVTRATALRA